MDRRAVSVGVNLCLQSEVGIGSGKSLIFKTSRGDKLIL